jgi:hypothetical protein
MGNLNPMVLLSKFLFFASCSSGKRSSSCTKDERWESSSSSASLSWSSVHHNDQYTYSISRHETVQTSTYFCKDVPQRLFSPVNLEDGLLPVNFVVGQRLEKLQPELVARLSHLTRAVLPPTKEDDVMDDVLQHVKLQKPPAKLFPCTIHDQYINSIPGDLLCAMPDQNTVQLFCTQSVQH